MKKKIKFRIFKESISGNDGDILILHGKWEFIKYIFFKVSRDYKRNNIEITIYK